jgi:hypothetical protein
MPIEDLTDQLEVLNFACFAARIPPDRGATHTTRQDDSKTYSNVHDTLLRMTNKQSMILDLIFDERQKKTSVFDRGNERWLD